MYRGLVVCRAGMGSSILLKIKVDQVIKENGYPITTDQGNLDSLIGFTGDVIFTMEDLAKELKDSGKYVIGICNIMAKNEIKDKIEKFLCDIKKEGKKND